MIPSLEKLQLNHWLLFANEKDKAVDSEIRRLQLFISKEIAIGFFREHPSAKDDVMKACYAWHDDIEADYRHSFSGNERSSICLFCGRSREDVRYDDLPPHCLEMESPKLHYFGGSAPWTRCVHCEKTREELGEMKSGEIPGFGLNQCPSFTRFDIKETLYNEEVRFMKLLDRGKSEIPKLVKKMGISGDTLAKLHHTHGYDPETVSAIIDVPNELMAEYYEKMENERTRSRAAMKRKVVTVVI